jgi:hypothetical protein
MSIIRNYEQREKFATLTATVDIDWATRITLSNKELLSPRRIYRQVWSPRLAVNIADVVFKLMQDWRDRGFTPTIATTRRFSAEVTVIGHYYQWFATVTLHSSLYKS